ncbi:hypothetical protein I302_100805 [Kwoniella bestiolae CBS 10118]|uniref:Uncharacterized protein n=1 Tax=Kwoniella bestiolae CBS 10118 TaxID=1296100 RepID=A0A1B9G677_9TREE|nr:hypothetical protein I302_04178 [Kwoniella bestiolae CBS 10118]OCF26492.1 hypothetical protein I302_04178 [Kwoniella bestiolae CBS 10118]
MHEQREPKMGSYTSVEGLYWTYEEAKQAAKAEIGWSDGDGEDSDDELNEDGEFELEVEGAEGDDSRVWIEEREIEEPPVRPKKRKEVPEEKQTTVPTPPVHKSTTPTVTLHPSELAGPGRSKAITGPVIPPAQPAPHPPPAPAPTRPQLPKKAYVVLERNFTPEDELQTRIEGHRAFISLLEANLDARATMQEIGGGKQSDEEDDDDEDHELRTTLYAEEYMTGEDNPYLIEIFVEELDLIWPDPPVERRVSQVESTGGGSAQKKRKVGADEVIDMPRLD